MLRYDWTKRKKNSPDRHYPESDMQIECVNKFRKRWPHKIILAVPNGGKRNAREAARMKREGVLAGVPDLFIAEPIAHSHGLWVELKAGKGRLTENQINVQDKLNARNYTVITCRSVDEFIRHVEVYFSPTGEF